MNENPNNEVRCPIEFWNIERWTYITRKSVPDIISEDSYMVSSFGRVYSNITHRFMKLTPTKFGYFRVALTKTNHTTRYYLVHRIVKMEFDPHPDFNNITVNHLDDDRTNNFIWNLDWATLADNIYYMNMIRGTDIFKQYLCKYETLTQDKLDLIDKLLTETKYTFKDIANLVGCDYHTIELVIEDKKNKDNT